MQEEEVLPPQYEPPREKRKYTKKKLIYSKSKTLSSRHYSKAPMKDADSDEKKKFKLSRNNSNLIKK